MKADNFTTEKNKINGRTIYKFNSGKLKGHSFEQDCEGGVYYAGNYLFRISANWNEYISSNLILARLKSNGYTLESSATNPKALYSINTFPGGAWYVPEIEEIEISEEIKAEAVKHAVETNLKAGQMVGFAVKRDLDGFIVRSLWLCYLSTGELVLTEREKDDSLFIKIKNTDGTIGDNKITRKYVFICWKRLINKK